MSQEVLRIIFKSLSEKEKDLVNCNSLQGLGADDRT